MNIDDMNDAISHMQSALASIRLQTDPESGTTPPELQPFVFSLLRMIDIGKGLVEGTVRYERPN